MPFPDAVIIGAQKAATTGLYDTLAGHPDVVALQVQEAVILHGDIGEWGGWLRRYEPRLTGAPEHGTLLAKLATAMYFDDTLANILAMNGRARVIAILRHPVDRMLSLHRYAVQRGLERRTPEDALRADDIEGAYDWRLSSYGEGSRYAAAIDRVRRLFAENALFVDYADVHSGACLPAIQRFLQLPSRDIPTVRANESRTPRSLALARAARLPAARTLARSAVPARWRDGVRDRFDTWNSTSSAPVQLPLPAALRAELVERHLGDVLAAEEALGKALPSWRC